MLVCTPSFIATTSGLASGNTIEEAILHGIFEVVERDAVFITELNTLVMPDVKLQNNVNKVIKQQFEFLSSKDIQYHIKYIGNDINIPVFQVFLQGTISRANVYGYGAGAHLNKEIALSRAITEALQSYPTFSDAEWIQTRPLDHYVKKSKKNIDFSLVSDYKNRDILKNIEKCMELLKKQNMEVYVCNLSKEQGGFSVTRTLISGVQPSMTSEFNRISDRVYSLPRRLGLTSKRRNELVFGAFPGFATYSSIKQII